MPQDARAIANFILDYADEQGIDLTIMSLLKIIYFAHGWHLAEKNEPLVKNQFEAWQHGPVVRALYEQFSKSGDKPIKVRGMIFDPVRGTSSIAQCRLTSEEAQFLRNIFDTFAGFHAFELSHLSHVPGSPWDRIWNASLTRVNPGMKIPNELIRAHFLDQDTSYPQH